MAEFDKLEHFIYDFVPLTTSLEKADEYKEPQENDRIIIDTINSVSTSFINITKENNAKMYAKAFSGTGNFLTDLKN